MSVVVHDANRLTSAAGLAVLATCLALVACGVPSTASVATPNAPTPTGEAPITLHYNERPPYLVTTEDGVGGLTGAPTTQVFAASGIPYNWEQTPSKRQIYLLQQNEGRDCLVGWFKNAEREGFALHITDRMLGQLTLEDAAPSDRPPAPAGNIIPAPPKP